MAITLNANLMLGTLSNLIVMCKTHNGFSGDGVDDLLDFCKSDDLGFGDGKIIRTGDIATCGDYSETSSLLTVSKPTTKEQLLSIAERKVVPLSLNRWLLKDAFNNDNALGEFMVYIKSTMNQAKKKYLFDKLLTTLKNYSPTQTTQTITLTLESPTSSSTPAEKDEINIYNAKVISKKLLEITKAVNFYTNKYNDDTFTQIVSPSKLGFICNSKYDENLIVDTFATLFNSQEIKNKFAWGKTMVIPKEQLDSTLQENLIGYLFEKGKLQYGFGYEVGGEFFDISNLYTNYFLHFSYYMGVVKGACGVVIKSA